MANVSQETMMFNRNREKAPVEQTVKEVCEALKEKGYNSSDYNLDDEELNLKLKMYKLNEDYRKIRDCAKQFETVRKAPKGIQPDNVSTEIFYAYNNAYNKCKTELPVFKRLFTNTSKLVTNPYLSEAEHFRTLIRQLSDRIDEYSASKKQTKTSERFIFTATNPVISVSDLKPRTVK